MSEVIITRKGQDRLATGHSWIYRSDVRIEKHEREPAPGEIVLVRSIKGSLLGQASYSSESQIALRMLSVSGDAKPLDRQFWQQRLEMAVNLRTQVVGNAQAYRLVHGESDLLPGLIIDRYGDYFVIQTLSQMADALKETWVDLIKEMFNPKAIVERNDLKVRNLEGLDEQKGILYGTLPEELIVDQHGVRFSVDLLNGQKTGLFLDQRENYLAAQRYATGRTLDCFTFAGGFALHMARTATSVQAIDVSETAIAQAQHNATLNGLENIEFKVANIFDMLKILEEQGEVFDTIVLDPPAFAKSRSAVEAAIRGYKEINLRAMKLLKPGGILISCSCSFNVDEELFLDIIKTAGQDVKRSVQLLEKRTQSRDHPILLSIPETYYLKAMVLRII